MKRFSVQVGDIQEVGSVEEYREKVRIKGGGRPKVKASVSEVVGVDKPPTIGEIFAGR